MHPVVTISQEETFISTTKTNLLTRPHFLPIRGAFKYFLLSLLLIVIGVFAPDASLIKN